MHSVVVHISLDKNNLNHQQQNTFPKFAIRYLIIEEIYQCGRIKHIKKITILQGSLKWAWDIQSIPL